jgi:hypothetical protein
MDVVVWAIASGEASTKIPIKAKPRSGLATKPSVAAKRLRWVTGKMRFAATPSGLRIDLTRVPRVVDNNHLSISFFSKLFIVYSSSFIECSTHLLTQVVLTSFRELA